MLRRAAVLHALSDSSVKHADSALWNWCGPWWVYHAINRVRRGVQSYVGGDIPTVELHLAGVCIAHWVLCFPKSRSHDDLFIRSLKDHILAGRWTVGSIHEQRLPPTVRECGHTPFERNIWNELQWLAINDHCNWIVIMDLMQQLNQFAWALWNHAKDGFRIVTPQEAETRLAICQACDQFDGNRCLACGCKCTGEWMNKVTWASESCPKGKWEAIEKHPSGRAFPPTIFPDDPSKGAG